MLIYAKILFKSIKESVHYFKEHLYLGIMIHRHEVELERRKVLRR
ncbi:hypothetical protein [Methanobacterium spitsbergense]|nr:hypothetical protein [Methanobacterium spitsbergense]